MKMSKLLPGICFVSVFLALSATAEPERAQGTAAGQFRLTLPGVAGDSVPHGPGAEPTDFYPQTYQRGGFVVRAPAGVDPLALLAAGGIAEEMTRGNSALLATLESRRAALVIIPRHRRLTELPEFAHLAGQLTTDGRRWDDLRGIGGGPGAPCGVGEENLVQQAGDVAYHEIAHTIQALTFSAADTTHWRSLFIQTDQAGTLTGKYAMTNDGEFFAELSQSYFGIGGPFIGRSALQSALPDVFDFLHRVYG